MCLFILPITANLISFSWVKIEPVSVWKSRGTKTATKKLILINRAHGREDSQCWEHEMCYDAFFLVARWIFSPRPIFSPAPLRQPKGRSWGVWEPQAGRQRPPPSTDVLCAFRSEGIGLQSAGRDKRVETDAEEAKVCMRCFAVRAKKDEQVTQVIWHSGWGKNHVGAGLGKLVDG